MPDNDNAPNKKKRDPRLTVHLSAQQRARLDVLRRRNQRTNSAEVSVALDAHPDANKIAKNPKSTK